MIGNRTLSIVPALLLLLTTGGIPSSAQTPNFTRLQRDADVLHGTIEEISREDHTMVLLSPEGTRQTIHYDTETVVFDDGKGAAPKVVPGQEALVRCRRQVAENRVRNTDLCAMSMHADRVYLPKH